MPGYIAFITISIVGLTARTSETQLTKLKFVGYTLNLKLKLYLRYLLPKGGLPAKERNMEDTGSDYSWITIFSESEIISPHRHAAVSCSSSGSASIRGNPEDEVVEDSPVLHCLRVQLTRQLRRRSRPGQGKLGHKASVRGNLKPASGVRSFPLSNTVAPWSLRGGSSSLLGP